MCCGACAQLVRIVAVNVSVFGLVADRHFCSDLHCFCAGGLRLWGFGSACDHRVNRDL